MRTLNTLTGGLRHELPGWFTAAVAVLTLAGCGGETNPSPPPPPPPPDNTRAVSPHAGDGQRAKTGTPVAVPPAVRVVNAGGSPVSGVGVAFAVGTGGGSVTGGNAVTGSDGVATVGTWTLGGVGSNTLIATVTGATSGSPVTFTATADEVLVQPSRDTTLSGVVAVTRLIVPQGVRVTVRDSLVVRADSLVQIDGAIVGDCTPVTVEGKQDVILNGVLRNDCTDLGQDGARLRIVALGGYELNAGSEVSATGDVEVTNDPTLTDTEVEPAPAPAPAPAEAAAAAQGNRCFLRTRYIPRPAKRPTPPTGVRGADGRPGAAMRVDCRGDLLAGGGFEFRAMDGGDGARGVHQPASGRAEAWGGNGGAGGRLVFRATGNIGFAGTNLIRSGHGGNGGSAFAVAGGGSGPVAPEAEALGGNGGAPGLISFRFKISINYIDPTDVTIGNGGDGGDATAVGAKGADATAQQPAQAGGEGNAAAGDGGSTPSLQLHRTGAVTVVNPGNLNLEGGHGGRGGKATGEAGQGGVGSREHPNGADGGHFSVAGGLGGDALLRDLLGKPFGNGGIGGQAVFRNGNGGRGFSNCTAAGFGPGGNGGRGGDVSGVEGLGGTNGVTTARNGGAHLDFAGNGGNAGNGWPEPGVRGVSGADLADGSPRTLGDPSLQWGQFGLRCLFGYPQETRITINRSGPPPQSSCEGAPSSWMLRSVADEAMAFVVVSTHPSLRLAPAIGNVPARPAGTSGQVWSERAMQDFFDACKVSSSFVAEHSIQLTGLLSGFQLTIQIPVTVVLNQQ